MSKQRTQPPFRIPINTTSIAAGTSLKVSHTFDFDCTVLAITSAVKGQDAPHGDFRADIRINNVPISNKPFSIRALTKDGSGFWFKEEMGDYYYFKNGESITTTLYNDSAAAMTPSIQLIVVRGWKKYPGGTNLLENTGFAGLNIKRSKKQMLPYLFVIEPNATIGTGSNSNAVYKIGMELSILAIHSAARATAAGSHHKDFEVEMKHGSIDFQSPDANASARCLSNENAGFDFIKNLGDLWELEAQDNITTKLLNNTGGDLWSSIILLGFIDYLEETELQKLIKLRK